MALLLSGKLDGHLSEIDTQAEDMFSQLVERMAAQEGITEQLKTSDQIRWVGLMNTCKAQAEEIIYDELIYL